MNIKMKISWMLIIITSFSACYVGQFAGSYSEKDFQGKYASFYEEGESEIAVWYHFSKTKTLDNRFIKRAFFPETKTLTSQVEYESKRFTQKNGPAKYWTEAGILSMEGEHKRDKKFGEWKFYHRKGGALQSKGLYKNGKKTGTWKVFDNKGRLAEKLDYLNGNRQGPFIEYDTMMVIINEGFYKADTLFSQSKVVEMKSNDIYKNVEQMPYLSSCKAISDSDERKECSNQSLLKYIYSNLKYPAKARDLNLQGTVYVQFVVEKDGSISNIDVYKGLNQYFKDEVYRVISQMPSWEAGIQRGKQVRVVFTMPVRFKLA